MLKNANIKITFGISLLTVGFIFSLNQCNQLHNIILIINNNKLSQFNLNTCCQSSTSS